MNYNQNNAADIANQSVLKLSKVLGELLKKHTDTITEPEIRLVNEQRPQPTTSTRTSEDERLEMLGYNY